MGVFLDTSVPIRAQRSGLSHIQLLRRIRSLAGEVELHSSPIVLTELSHGVYRTKDPVLVNARRNFIEEFLLDVPMHPYTVEIAHLAGRLGGEQAALGETIPSVDLMIGATALFLGDAMLTANVRHFRVIPGLHVIEF